jgi:fatty acid amide hydrolase 2
MRNFLVSRLDKELIDAQRNLCVQLEKEHGITVEVIKLEKFDYSLQMWARMMATARGKPFCHYMGNEITPVNPFCEFFKAMFGASVHTIPAIGLGMLEKFEALVPKTTTNVYTQMARELRQEIEGILGDNGVLIYPSHPTTALRHNVPIFYPFNFAYTGIFNVLYFPVTQCPVGLSKAGLPMGVQLVASNGNDHLTLAVAEELEQLMGGWEKLCSDKQQQD